jgi:nitrogen fixation NifU-like protein
VGNPRCGDIMKIYMKIENNIIEDVKFKKPSAAEPP